VTLPALDHAQRVQRDLRRTNIAMLILVLIACVVLVIGATVLYVKVDAKASRTEQIVKLIRTDQIKNTQVSTSRSDCQNRAFDALLTDAKLAFSGDKNPADYLVAPKC
jgi:hypothetical protein